MQLNEAVSRRLVELMDEHKLTQYEKRRSKVHDQ